MSDYVSQIDITKSDLFKRARPLVGRLDIELTERCNNNCVHCCINLPEHDLSASK